jgi:hypothetical protein
MAVVGDECHIISKSEEGPRNDPNLELDHDSYDNLILLCKTHHKIIDDQPSEYPISRLKKIRSDHEKKVRDCLNTVSEVQADNEIDWGWFQHKISALEGFFWCCIGIILPLKADVRSDWNSTLIRSLKQAILDHSMGETLLWTQRFCPIPEETEDLIKIRNYRNRARVKRIPLVDIGIDRCQSSVHFIPQLFHQLEESSDLNKPSPRRQGWFDFWFNNNGYITSSVGLPWTNQKNICADEVCAALYAILDLCTQDSIKRCYPNCDWDSGQLRYFVKLNQFPGGLNIPWQNATPPKRFPALASSYELSMQTMNLGEKELEAKRITHGFLAWAGFMDYEEALDEFNVKEYLPFV